MSGQRGSERRLIAVRYFLLGSWILLILSLLSTVHFGDIALARLSSEIIWSAIALLPIFLMVAGHEAWRRICPLSLISALPLKLGISRKQKNSNELYDNRPVLRADSFLVRNRLVIQFSLLLIGIFLRYNFAERSPEVVAALMLGVMFLAFFAGTLYGGRTWCHVFCPISPVQKIYSSPGGILEKLSHFDEQPIKKSMCRTVIKGKEVSTCIRCIAPCPDIDLEEAYWSSARIRGHVLIYSGYLGLLIGITACSLLALEKQRLFLDHKLGWIVIVSGAIAVTYLFFRLVESAGKKLSSRRGLNYSNSNFPHLVRITISWLCLNLFYHSIADFEIVSRGTMTLLALVVSCVWVYRGLQRSARLYETEVSGVRKKKALTDLNSDLKQILGSKALHELSREQSLTLSQVLPEFKLLERRRVYRAIISIIKPRLKENGLNMDAVLIQTASSLGLSEQEYQLALSTSELQFSNSSRDDVDSKTKILAFSKKMDQLVSRQIRADQSLSSAIKNDDLIRKIRTIERYFSINHLELDSIYRSIANRRNTELKVGLSESINIIKFSQYRTILQGHSSAGVSMNSLMDRLLLTKIDLSFSKIFSSFGNLGDCDECTEILNLLLKYVPTYLSDYVHNHKNRSSNGSSGRMSAELLLRLGTGLQRGNVTPAGNHNSKVIDSPGIPPKGLNSVLKEIIKNSDPILASSALAFFSKIDLLTALEKLNFKATPSPGTAPEILNDTLKEIIKTDEPILAASALALLSKIDLLAALEILETSPSRFAGHWILEATARNTESKRKKKSNAKHQENVIGSSKETRNEFIFDMLFYLSDSPAFSLFSIAQISNLVRSANYVVLDTENEYLFEDDELQYFVVVLKGRVALGDLVFDVGKTIEVLGAPGKTHPPNSFEKLDIAPISIVGLEPGSIIAVVCSSTIEMINIDTAPDWLSTKEKLLDAAYPSQKDGLYLGLTGNLTFDFDIFNESANTISCKIEEISEAYISISITNPKVEEAKQLKSMQLCMGTPVSVIYFNRSVNAQHIFVSPLLSDWSANKSTMILGRPVKTYRYERRNDIRVPWKTVCKLKPITAIDSNVSFSFFTIDISKNGLLLAVNFEQLKPFQQDPFDFELQLGPSAFRGSGRIFPSGDQADGFTRLFFKELDEEHRMRIEDFLLEKLFSSDWDNRPNHDCVPAWTGLREFVVTKIVRESVDVSSFYLQPVDKKKLPAFLPGQFLTVKVDINDGKSAYRCYSLSDYGSLEFYRISVKRVVWPDGIQGLVSHFLHDNVSVGDTVSALAPAGSFVLNTDSSAPIVLIAGGIGITPLFTMLKHLTLANSFPRKATLLYGIVDGSRYAMRDELNSLVDMFPNVTVRVFAAAPRRVDRLGIDYHEPGLISIQAIRRYASRGKDLFYICGPIEMMQALEEDLIEWGVSKNRIFWESFQPIDVSVKLDKSDGCWQIDFFGEKSVSWNNQWSNILEAAEQNEIDLPFACRRGQCKSCRCLVLNGSVLSYATGHPEVISEGEFMSCCAVPRGDLTLARA